MRSMKAVSAGFAIVALFQTGCARMKATTELKADGTFTRQLEFHVPASDNAQGANFGPKGDDIFGFPAAPAWTVTKVKKDNDLTIKAVRTMKAADVLPSDILLKGPKGSALVTNTLSIRQISPGRWEYKETLHWKGEKTDDMKRVPAELSAVFKETLPAELATPANIQAISAIAFKEFWRALFGPGDPLVSQLLMHQDLAERKIMRRIGTVLNTALLEMFKDKLTQEQRGRIVKRIVERATADTKSSTTAKADPQKAQGNDTVPLTALTFVVKLPGKLVSTNGEADEVTGEVYWALYGEAAAVGDVTMTAVCDTGKQ
jgi:hypothetical protein